MIVNQQYRKLNPSGATPREISEVVNNLVNGKSNNTGYITLATGNVTTTTIYDERIGYDSFIALVPSSSAAFNDRLPYGSISNNSSQYITTATPFNFSTQDVVNGIYLSSNKMYFRNSGNYNLQFSVQFANTNITIEEAYIWLRKNGTDIVGTGSKYSVPNKHGGADGYLIAVANFFVDIAAGDYIELMWDASSYANSGGTTLGIYTEAYAASGSVPAIPSVVLTAQYNQASASSNVYVSSQQKGQATLTHFSNDTANKTYRYLIVG